MHLEGRLKGELALHPGVRLAVLALFLCRVAVAGNLSEVAGLVPFLLLSAYLLGLRVSLAGAFHAGLFAVVVALGAGLSGGTKEALLLISRATVALLFVCVFLGGASPVSLLYGLRSLKVPERLCALAFLSYRFLFLVGRDYGSAVKSARARGFTFRTSPATYGVVGRILAGLVVKSRSRSESVRRALLCRGFSGSFPVFHREPLSLHSVLFLLISAVYLVLTWSF